MPTSFQAKAAHSLLLKAKWHWSLLPSTQAIWSRALTCVSSQFTALCTKPTHCGPLAHRYVVSLCSRPLGSVLFTAKRGSRFCFMFFLSLVFRCVTFCCSTFFFLLYYLTLVCNFYVCLKLWFLIINYEYEYAFNYEYALKLSEITIYYSLIR